MRWLPPRWTAFLILLLGVVVLTGCDGDDDDDDDDDDADVTEVTEAEFVLQLLHFADMDGATGALQNVRGFSAILEMLRAEYPDRTLVLTSGDNYIPGPRYAAAAEDGMRDVLYVGVPGQGRADIAFCNILGVRVSCVGNHDLDSGTEAFADVLMPELDGASFYPGALFPYLSANLDFTTDANLAGLVTADGQDASDIPGSLAASCTVEVDGETIGIVGASTPTLGSITSTEDITVLPAGAWTNAQLAALIQPAVDALTARGIDKIVLLCHMQTLSVERALAPLLRDVDIIVGGGSNTVLADGTDRLRGGDTAADTYPVELASASGDPVLLVNTDGDYEYVGRLVVGFDEDGVIMPETVDEDESGAWATDQQAVIETGAVPDPLVSDVAEALEDILFAQEGNVFGNTSVYIDGRRGQVRTQETNMGNLSADANLWYARLEDPSVQISIKNGGGIRDDIGYFTYPPGSTDPGDLEFYPPAAVPPAGKGDGDISEFDIKGTLRFDNGLALVDITAQDLVALIEHAVSDVENVGGRFPQVAGIRFSYDPTAAAGARLVNLVVLDAGGAIDDTVVEGGVLQGDPTRAFRMVILDFLANEGDGYNVPDTNRVDLKGNAPNDPGAADFSVSGGEQDALAEYLAATYPDSDTPFDMAETDASGDTRIQDVTQRADTVLVP